MSIIGSNILAGASGQAGYNLNNSLRFRSSASGYLNRTLSTPTSNYIWTWSAWVKRGSLGTDQSLFGVAAGSSGNIGSTPRGAISWDAGDTFSVFANDGASTTLSIVTTQVFRDPSAWYHIVVAVDTTQATASNRFKLYVNGIQVTSLSTATYYPQNASTVFNGTGTSKFHAIGMYANLSSFLDGYMTEINFVDGQALTPSSFGETSTTTGSWIPKKYTGSYGTNGFYLKGRGTDNSGNGNNWTENNFNTSNSALTTYDIMLDVPTNTSATVANYCTWNPIVSPNATYSNGNLRFAGTANNVWISPTMGVSSGKFYWEYTVEAISSTILHIGITKLNGAITEAALIARTYYGDGTKYSFETGTITGTSFGSSYAVNDIIQVALDMDSGKVWFGKNNTWQASGNPSAGTNEAYSSLSGTFGPFAGKDAAGNQPTVVLNCGQRPFTYTPPSGFVALNTYNLPTPTILQGNKYMDATLYTGTNAILTVTNAGGFYPDFTWLRIRNQAYGYSLFDSVRGATKSLQSQSTNAETTQGAGTGINSFNSNGFTLGTDVATNGSTNYNTGTYVAWQWLANAGSTVSNTSGSITSTVSVNTTAGFSVVTYTGTGTAATVGHGLGVAPAMIIIKRRNGVTDWATYHASVGNTKALFLNRDIAADTGASYWNNTSPTSTVFTVGTGADVNPSSGTMVAYCWAEIAGFSKFGSYTGNGSADGPFVYTGFRPKYVLIKRTDGPNAWYVLDSTRNTYNVMNLYLELQDPAAEGTFTFWDFLSNGFKLRQTASGINGSGQTIIYMAFAENPFKNANAR